MEINIKQDNITEEAYVLADRTGFILLSFKTLTEAVNALSLYSKAYIKGAGLRIRHHISAYIDNDVDCLELKED